MCFNQFKARLMWIPAHVGIHGNDMIVGIAKNGAKIVLCVALGCPQIAF
jgi:hypothetical protein